MNQQLYTTQELLEMTLEEHAAARANGFVKPELPASEAPGYQAMGADTPTPSQGVPVQASNPYAATSWGSNFYDFRVPSGQLCQMRKLQPEELAEKGILDKITRLPALAQEQIDQAEGKPPTLTKAEADALPELLSVLSLLLPLVVVQPELWPEPAEGEERVAGRVYVRDVELADRIAIMERALEGVAKMDNFRPKS
jgi:hypothetical protein